MAGSADPFSVPFPPPPRGTPGLLDQVLESLDQQVRLPWRPVHLHDVARPWVGVQGRDVAADRPWHWDVVVPDDIDGSPLERDPLVLAVEQDLVIIDLCRVDLPGVVLQLQVPVRAAPDQIDFPAAAIPAPPWELGFSTGWSTAAIAMTLAHWTSRQLGRTLVPDPGPEIDGSGGAGHDDRYEIADDLHVTAKAFDQLLELDHRAAATVTLAFTAARDALDCWR